MPHCIEIVLYAKAHEGMSATLDLEIVYAMIIRAGCHGLALILGGGDDFESKS